MARTAQGLRTGNFKSRLEARVNISLRQLKPRYEEETLTYVQEHKYTPDFSFPNSRVLIEAKGFFDSADRAKHLRIKKAHPDFEVRFVFQNAHQKISKKSKTTYAMWADRHGFKWADKQIPSEWVAEILNEQASK